MAAPRFSGPTFFPNRNGSGSTPKTSITIDQEGNELNEHGRIVSQPRPNKRTGLFAVFAGAAVALCVGQVMLRGNSSPNASVSSATPTSSEATQNALQAPDFSATNPGFSQGSQQQAAVATTQAPVPATAAAHHQTKVGDQLWAASQPFCAKAPPQMSKGWQARHPAALRCVDPRARFRPTP